MVEVTDKLKFATTETIEVIFDEIRQLIPHIETEWECVKGEKGIFYKTQIETQKKVQLEVHENELKLVLLSKEGEVLESRNIKRPSKNRNSIYRILSKRFNNKKEFDFYKGVAKVLRVKLSQQKEPNEYSFTEQANSRNSN